MNLINQAAQAAIAKEYPLPKKPGYCLAAVRVVIERAFGWPSHDLYKRIVTEHVQANNTGEPWAVDAEKSFKVRGLDVPTYQSPRPGDVMFNHSSPPWGHVGIVVEHAGGLYVLENAQVKRGLHLYDALNLCPLHLWGGITTIGRLPDTDVPDRALKESWRVFVDDGTGPRVPEKKRKSYTEIRGLTLDPVGDKLTVYINTGKNPPALPLPIKPGGTP